MSLSGNYIYEVQAEYPVECYTCSGREDKDECRKRRRETQLKIRDSFIFVPKRECSCRAKLPYPLHKGE
ncbi:MAG: hypothetical protein QG620_36 [Patescibacteria group bacterium]|nr:hypothetical protein [Patescibacteria group bacterium]